MRYKLLIIEPNNAITELIKESAEGDHYDITQSHSGLLGINIAQKQQPDLILCDIDTQQPNGYEVLKVLQANRSVRHIPVIMLGDYDDSKVYRWAISHGAEDYIPFPIDSADLIDKIEARLARHKNQPKPEEAVTQELGVEVDYSMPHTFRSPLMMILGYADLLALDHESVSPAFIREAATSILMGGKSLERLIQNRLVYTQLREIAITPKKRAVFSKQYLSHTEDVIYVAAMNAAERHGRGNEIKLDLMESRVQASQENLAKLIEELVDNACKFSEPGTPIGVKSRQINDRFYIFIADSGQGISPETIAKLKDSSNTLPDGLGLGFAIAKLIIDLYGGEIGIESEVGRGTIITVRLSM